MWINTYNTFIATASLTAHIFSTRCHAKIIISHTSIAVTVHLEKMCTALEEEKLYFFHKKGKLLGRKGNPSIYRDSQISKPYLFSIFIILYEASWPGWTNGWMANRIHTVMFAITKEGGKPLTKDTLTVLPSRWLNEFQRGDTHTHTHTHTHAQIRQVWERPLALILLETACSSTSYHIPAEQYTTLGSKCSYLMLKGLYAQHAYSQTTERKLESGPQKYLQRCACLTRWKGESLNSTA